MTNEGHYHKDAGKARYRRKAYKEKIEDMDSQPRPPKQETTA